MTDFADVYDAFVVSLAIGLIFGLINVIFIGMMAEFMERTNQKRLKNRKKWKH